MARYWTARESASSGSTPPRGSPAGVPVSLFDVCAGPALNLWLIHSCHRPESWARRGERGLGVSDSLRGLEAGTGGAFVHGEIDWTLGVSGPVARVAPRAPGSSGGWCGCGSRGGGGGGGGGGSVDAYS